MSENLNLFIRQGSFHTIWIIAQVLLIVDMFMVSGGVSSCGGFNSCGVQVFSPREVFLVESLEVFLYRVHKALANNPSELAWE